MYDNNDLNNQTFGEGGDNTPPNPQYVTYVPYGLTPETYEEKRNIKKTANVIGGALLMLLGFTALISFAFVTVMLLMGFSGEAIDTITKDAAVNQFVQIMVSSLIFTIPFIFIFKVCGFKIRELIDFKKPEKQTVLPLFLIGISFCAFANIATSFAGRIFESFGINYDVDFGETPKGFFGFMLSLIATAIIPPLVEEFACRGLILGALRKFGDTFAIITSSIVFGLLHGNFQQMPFAFLVGLVLAYITVKSGNIWIAIAVHAFNNLVSVVFTAFEDVIPIEISNILYTLLLIILLMIGFLGVMLLSKRNFSFNLEGSTTESTEGQKYKWFFSSATIIIFIVIIILQSLQYFV